MTALPWMPLYIADYLADTGHLSTVEHGAYMLLIMHYWQHEGLPDDERRLARIARLSPDEWQDVRDSLADLFDEGWKHGRIDSEITAAKVAHGKRSAAGRAGARARYGNAVAKLEQPDNERMPRAGGCRSEVDTYSTEEEEASPRAREFAETFWPAYPWDAGEDKALAAFVEARDRAPLDEIMAGLERYKAEKPKDRHWMLGWKFLAESRWRDRVKDAPKAQGPPPPPKTHVKRDDPSWSRLSDRYRQEFGKPPPTDSNDGWFYPNDWLAH